MDTNREVHDNGLDDGDEDVSTQKQKTENHRVC